MVLIRKLLLLPPLLPHSGYLLPIVVKLEEEIRIKEEKKRGEPASQPASQPNLLVSQ